MTAPQHPRDFTTRASSTPHPLDFWSLARRETSPQEGFPTRGFEPVTPFFCNETSHLATKLLPKRVGMLKFRTTNKCAKYRKKHRKRGQTCLLRPSRGRKITHFVPFSRHLSRVQKDSRYCISLIYSLLYKSTNGRLFQFQLFQLFF